ncbi:MAG: 4-aminobutyrate aminotransferase-like enzyme [Myxococcota bacterium]
MTHPTEKPNLVTTIPGPASLALAKRLAEAESQNVTCLDPTPIFWQRASGANVWDVDGNCFVDLTAAFGVANVGHAHPRVVAAVAEQATQLLHGMGDVYPPAIKVELLEALISRYPGGVPARGVLSSSGSDAVETAIKTAIMATGRPGILAFRGAYHGLSLGALDATWREDFRDPFASRLPERTAFAPYGDLDAARQTIADATFEIGAILVEPIQGRGGERVPEAGFLKGLEQLCNETGMLLIADEIYTGFGRTGDWFACDYEGVTPDLLCIGKGMASGMPISACLGRSEVMDTWPLSRGEALHTQTFIGHPPGCAAALASIDVLESEGLVALAASTGAKALEHLSAKAAGNASIAEVRGRGLMIGIEVAAALGAVRACERALARGIIALPSGGNGEVVSITPPLCIDEQVLLDSLDLIIECIQ